MQSTKKTTMKRILFFLLFASSFSCWAQTQYKPFVEEGKVWTMKCNNWDRPWASDYVFSYYLEGDTVIGGKECKKLYSFNAGNNNSTAYISALYEIDGKVYFIPANKEGSYVLYDFSVPLNETTSINEFLHPHDWPPFTMKNYERRPVNLMGTERNCLLVKSVKHEGGFNTGWWIEGIGSVNGPLDTWSYGAHGKSTFLLECSVNGKVIYSNSDFSTNIKSAPYDYEQFLYEDKVWTMGYRTSYDVLKNSETKLCGDTIIDGIHFKRKYEKEWLRGEKKPDEWKASAVYIGQEGGKVYLYDSMKKKMIVDMDFTLKEGDTFTCSGFGDTTGQPVMLVTAVTKEWIIYDFPVKATKIYLQSQDNPDFTDVWIDGIGSLTTGINGTMNYYANGEAQKLVECNFAGIILHEAEDLSTAVDKLDLSKQSGETIYDLQGRRISSHPSKGIYIRGGRKYVVE